MLARVLAAVAKVAGRNNTKYILNCVRCRTNKSQTILTATDGRALIEARFEANPKAPKGVLCIPAVDFLRAASLSNDIRRDGEIRLSGSSKPGNTCRIEVLDARATLRCDANDGTFPRTDDIFPAGQPVAQITFDADRFVALVNAVADAAYPASDCAPHGVTLTWYSDTKPALITAKGKDGVEVRALLTPIKVF